MVIMTASLFLDDNNRMSGTNKANTLSSQHDDFGICTRRQIYSGSSSQNVVCRCCGTAETSGSWRRGWQIREILEGTSVQRVHDTCVANLCNRCGQRWAKMGKCADVEDVKTVMTSFVHSMPRHSDRPLLETVQKKRRRSSVERAPCDMKTQGKYIGYATKRVRGVRSSYALFWIMDKMAECTLVVIGVDPRSSGHFIYQKSPLVRETLPALHCTNRSETFAWIQDNFSVHKPLAASLKAKVPDLSAEQVECILKGEDRPREMSCDKELLQHLCATCGCNHPTEDCPSQVHSPGAAVVLTHQDQDLSDTFIGLDPNTFNANSPIPAYFDLGTDEQDLPDGISPLGDHIFASPKEFTPRDYSTSPQILLGKSSIQDAPVQQMKPDDIIIRSTINTDGGLMSSMEKRLKCVSMFSTWTRMLEDFLNGQSLVKTQHVISILQELLTYENLSLQELSQSRILIPVSQLCTHEHPIISSTSRQLATMWRSLAVTTIHNSRTV